jgi:hypothetical protein
MTATPVCGQPGGPTGGGAADLIRACDLATMIEVDLLS